MQHTLTHMDSVTTSTAGAKLPIDSLLLQQQRNDAAWSVGHNLVFQGTNDTHNGVESDTM